MTDIHFGPAWLRDTFVQPPQGSEHGGGGPTNGGGGGNDQQRGGNGGKMASNLNIMAPAKLAEFRYGREEMLALFTLPDEYDSPLRLYQEYVIKKAGLLVDRPDIPLNLSRSMSEEEQRAWQKGANSDTSLRLYRKEMPPGSMPGGPGMGRGAPGERGRGRGRGGSGYFDRQRPPVQDEEDGGATPGNRREESERGRGFGRGGARSFGDRGSWFERSNSTSGGQPGEEGGTNGNISPRKGYTRAPFDDWRKPTNAGGAGAGNAQGQGGEEEDGGGWRTGPSSSGRRWNAPAGSDGTRGGGTSGWRSSGPPASGDREYHNGSTWHRETAPDEHFNNRRGGYSGGRPGYNRNRSRQDSDIPEWASEDISDAAKASGGFDSSGKFSFDKPKPRVISLNRDLKDDESAEAMMHHRPSLEDEAFEDEEVDVDDLPENMRKESKMVKEEVLEVVQKNPPLQQQEQSPWGCPDPSQDSHANIDPMAHDLVSKLIEEDDTPPQPQQLQNQPQQRAPSPPQPPQNHQQPPPPQQIQPNSPTIPSVQQIQWFYLDPQGNEQGPFTSSDMMDWYEAGYFPPELRLRRAGIDRRFAALNDISRLYGRVPFTPGPAPGPLLDHPVQQQQTPSPPVQPPPQPQQASPPHSSSSNTPAMLQHMQQQQALLQQQILRQQQQLLAIQQSPLSELEKAQLINKVLQLSLLPQPQAQAPQAQQPQPKPSPPLNNSSSASDLATMMLQQQQQQQQMSQQPSMPPNEPMRSSPHLPEGLSLLGNNQEPQEPAQAPFNPIKSLLIQLQQQHEQHPPPPQQQQQPPSHIHETHSDASMQQHDSFIHQNQAAQQQQQRPPVSPSPPPLQQQSPQVPRSIWGESHQGPMKEKMGVWGEDNAARQSPNSFYNQVQQQRDVGAQPQAHFEEETSAASEEPGFVKPKSSEKKDKKAKRAEEKRRAKEREAKKLAAAQEYIPGMEGSVRPSAFEEEEQNEMEDQETPQQGLYGDETPEQIEAEQQGPQQPQYQPKLAPWAKISEKTTTNGAESSLSLAEIQKIEEEREREAKLRREMQEAAQARARQEEEAQRRQQGIGLNWATAVNTMDGQKSLAEIQAEEQRQERERQERERRERKARQKDMSFATASVWGSASTNLSWATRASAAAPPPMPPGPSSASVQQQPQSMAPAPTNNGGGSMGFWDSNDPPVQKSQQQQPQSQQQQQPKKNKGKNKAKEESKVAAIFKESKGKPANEFEEWCISALEKLDPQVDIPTFLGFLNDVENPYDVNDYVKNYIGDGKGPKNFAKEYVERRSKWKNALKSSNNFEDELLTPAAAINPNEPDEAVPVPGGGLVATGGGGGGRKNKKKNKSKSKLDASHLLGFSVAAADRPNAGEIDLPQ